MQAKLIKYFSKRPNWACICLFIYLFINLFELYECFVYMYVCASCVPSAQASLKRYPVGLELRKTVSCHVRTGNPTFVLRKSKEQSFFLFFQDRVSLCSLGCSGIHSVEQAGLKLRDLPASASQVLGMKAHMTHRHTCRQNTHTAQIN